MLIDVIEEKMLPTVIKSTPYVLSLLREFIEMHRNPVLATWLFDGDYVMCATSQEVEDRRNIEKEFLRRIRKRHLRPSKTFCIVTIYLQAEDGETTNTCAHCATTIEQSIRDWASANDELCVMAMHLEQNETKTNAPMIPHIHVIYKIKADAPNRLSTWLDKTVLEPEN